MEMEKLRRKSLAIEAGYRLRGERVVSAAEPPDPGESQANQYLGGQWHGLHP